MEGKRRRLQSESQAQSVILLTKIKGNGTIEISFTETRTNCYWHSPWISVEELFFPHCQNSLELCSQTSPTDARHSLSSIASEATVPFPTPTGSVLTPTNHRFTFSFLTRFFVAMQLLCLRFAVRKGSSHTPDEITRAQTRSLSFSLHDFDLLCIFPFGYSLTVYTRWICLYE